MHWQRRLAPVFRIRRIAIQVTYVPPFQSDEAAPRFQFVFTAQNKQFKGGDPHAGEPVALQAKKVGANGIGAVHHTDMYTVDFAYIAKNISAQTDILHLILVQAHFLKYFSE